MYNTIVGFSLLSIANTTYNAFYFVTLKPWEERTPEGLTADVIMRRLNERLAGLPEAQAFASSRLPPFPGIGTSGGATFMLEDRSGQGRRIPGAKYGTISSGGRQRPEFASLTTTFIPTVPQVFADVDRDKVLKQGVDLNSVYQTLQAFMGGLFVNYFNRFGRVWQVYVQAEGEFRTEPRTSACSASATAMEIGAALDVGHHENDSGPEFTNRFNGYRAAQINGIWRPDTAPPRPGRPLEEVFAQTMPREMGYDYSGMSFQEQVAAQGVPASAIFGSRCSSFSSFSRTV